ncbi:peroxisome proliferator-activated receptor gamma coactivator-related protein 1-like [Poeciliopsis prolifica]|uniref:peroxisome proliferator-activated receptor gamma coactivator-related protein 1-like n=1 Tax=Poeciliopsis prolifica TaxID=188132 RepID=UPI002413327E|nr:peroxisome proliferator-activated receptor gamma coactivator-related protein 1-like [Poeciliopsis prolifica]
MDPKLQTPGRVVRHQAFINSSLVVVVVVVVVVVRAGKPKGGVPTFHLPERRKQVEKLHLWLHSNSSNFMLGCGQANEDLHLRSSPHSETALANQNHNNNNNNTEQIKSAAVDSPGHAQPPTDIFSHVCWTTWSPRPACQRTMWRSNMAARKRGEESDLTTGNSECPSRDALNELILSRSQDVDHSILAIFEDSTVSPESHNGAEEANESLLCALTEMLDRVGQDDDDDGTFSPFDVVPNTELLHRAERTVEPRLQEPSPSFRLRPRPKPPNETSRTRSDGEQKVERNSRPQMLKKQNQKLLCSKNVRAKTEVEVFTSTSLVSLVKLMHPYCLKLHVEKEDDPRKNESLFSQEEVWRYEQPSEDSDEEINVVSEDEAPSKQTEEEEEGGSRGDGSPLKSVLLNGKTSREKKKRVSFGPVHVASFDESEEEEIEEKIRETLKEPSGSALEPSTQPSEGNNEEQEKKKGETRTKSLSLQEYRQLRLNRRPPVEELRNYTTRWPSVSELPKELPPILPLRRPNTAAEFSTFTQHVKLKEAKLPNHLHHRRLKSSKPEPRISSASPPPDHSATPSGRKPDSRRSPVKKPKLVSSDPPNPVLVRLRSNKHPQQIQNESQALYERSSEPKLSTSPPNEDSKAVDTPLLQEVNAKLTEMPPRVYPESPQDLSRAERPLSPDVGFTAITPRLHRPPTESHMMSPFTDTTDPEPPQNDCRNNSATDQSGIEAADLTSLLEQFEETQAIDNGNCNNRPEPVSVSSSLSGESNCRLGLDRLEPERPELISTSPLKPTVGPPEPPSPGDGLKDVRSLDVPEPLHTEVVLSTQRNPPTRCRSLSLKLVQIIEPRPLPTRKVRTSQSEPPAAHSSAQIYAYLCCDHDYCSSAERCPPQAQLLAEAATEPERTADHVSENRRSDQTGTGSETDTSTEKALRFSPRKAADRRGRDDSRAALCGLPTPPPTPPGRGRSRRRYRVRSPRSDSGSSSSSCSCSPKRPRIRRRRSESSSCSSSPSSCATPPRRHRAARSRSRSWSRSRSRSSSPQIYHRHWRDVSASRESRRRSRERDMRIQKLKAIDERRVVYVGRIRRTMTHDELRERFSQFGEVECVSLHFRDGSDHYGFVTFYNTEDAFAAIDNGGKLRQPNELPFDLCFGGRRQFCNSDYADLDSNREAESPAPRSRFEDLDFDSLLKQAQRGLKR